MLWLRLGLGSMVTALALALNVLALFSVAWLMSLGKTVQARREPQRALGKNSRGAPNQTFSRGPSAALRRN